MLEIDANSHHHEEGDDAADDDHASMVVNEVLMHKFIEGLGL